MRRRAVDEGSISIEWVIVTPIIFLVFALIYVYARVAWANGNLDSATRDAARVASQAPDSSSAQTAAESVVATQFAKFHCTNGTAPTWAPVVVLSGTFAAGATITVTARCRYDISDAGLPGAPGSVTAYSVFSSMIDSNRTVG
jgi:Flp pilus assembly protein TadG